MSQIPDVVCCLAYLITIFLNRWCKLEDCVPATCVSPCHQGAGDMTDRIVGGKVELVRIV